MQPTNFSAFLNGQGTTGEAQLVGPFGSGTPDFVPTGQPLPYTINFSNPSSTSTVGQIRIVSQLDPNLDPRSFRLGDLQIGDLQVHIPNTVGSFQGDFDFTQSKGFILRVSAGIDVSSGTVTWLLQAIDPATGEVVTDPSRGLLPPGSNASGFVTYTALPLAGVTTGTQISAQASVLFDTSAPEDTNTVTNTVDAVAPTTTLTATPIVPGSSDYQVQWTATDDDGGSGVQGVTVYVAEDGGDYQIWLDQTTTTSGIYDGPPGHSYQFLALATDNAGNHEQPPPGLSVPSDGSQANLGALPTVPGTTTDLGTPAQPSTQPSTNPPFTQAQQGIPSPVQVSQPSEFQKILQPFTGRAFATGIAQSEANIGPLAIVAFPDGSALVSGGPARDQLFSFTAEGGQAGTPLATEPFPIYDMALDAAGNLWATTGGGPLLELNPQTGAIIGQYGDSLTQSLAIQPSTGLIYVSSGKGIEIFNPTTQSFTHFSDLRVGSLAFAPDGSFWAATWPQNQNDVIEFVPDSPAPNPITPQYHAQLMFQFTTDVDSIAFGQPGTMLAGLLFISHDDEASPGAGTDLTMVDLATLQSLAIATGGSRGDEIKTTALGSILLSQSEQVDILSPIEAPRVAGSNPPDGATAGLPLGTITVTFDHDMFQGDSTDPRSVLNPSNYQIIGDTAGPIAVSAVVYDASSRTATVTFDAIEAGGYTLEVDASIQSTEGLALAEPYSAHFQALDDLSSQVSISLFNGRASLANKTYSYSVIVTNNGTTPLLTPLALTFDGLQPVSDQVVGATNTTTAGTTWVDLSASVPGGELFPGQATTVATVTFSNPSGLKLSFKTGLLAMPAPNADPIFDSQPLTTATAGQLYNFPVAAHDPNKYPLSYLLVRGPAGMTVNPTSGLVSWLPTVASPALAPVVLAVYDSHGSRATLSYTITVGGVDQPPVLQPLPLQITGQEGQSLQVALSATDPQGLPLISWADYLPPGAVYDTTSDTLTWIPGPGQARTYADVQFFVSDGVNQVSVATTLLIAPTQQQPTLVQPADRTVVEGESVHIPLQASDPQGDPLSFSSTMLPGGAYLDPNTGVFDWTPAYFQQGVFQIPFTVSDGQLSVTQTTTITVLNVDAPPRFDNLSSWRVAEGQDINFRAFAFDPDNPGYVPPDRMPDGTLTALEGTDPTITYTVSGLPTGATFDPETDLFDWQTGYSDAGSYVVTFTATKDGVGTGAPLSTSVSVPITVLNTNRAPQITFIGNQTVDDKAVLTLPIQAIDPDGDPMVLTAGGTTDQGLPAFASFVDNGNGTGTFTFAPGPEDAGAYTINVTATDNGDGGGPAAVLSDSQTFIVTVNNPNRPPHLAPIGDKVAVVGQELQFTIHATDADQNPLTFSALGLPAAATLTPSSTYGDAVVTWTPISSDLGQTTVLFQVADNANGNPADVLTDKQSINLVVRLSNRAPVLLPVGDQTIAQQQTLTVALQATDPDNDPLTFSAANLPAGATLDPISGVLAWTPNLSQSGTFSNIVLSASDGNLTASQTLTIDVTAINQAPVLVPLVEQDGREGTALQFTLAAADGDGDQLTYSAISGLPSGAQFNTMTGQFKWTPTYSQAGDYAIEFGVTDPGGLSDQIRVNVHIDQVDLAPSLVVTNHQAVVGQPLSFTLLGSHPDQGIPIVLTYSALGLPEGASLDAHTGTFAWTPGPSQIGDYSVQFSVSDGELSATVPVVLRGTIAPVPPQVIVVLTPSFPAVPGQSVIVHVAASSLAPITGLSVTVAGQPLTLDSQGRATYTPQAPGRIAIAATATDGDGLVGQYLAVLKVRDPNDQTAPVVAFSPQLANARLTAATAIIGAIADTNLDTWVLDRAPIGSSTFTTLASGTSAVSSATLATFDPTVLANGPYVLRLTATDIAGRISQTTIVVEADSTAKPSQYLRTETDLSVVLAGSVVNLVRSYDSLTADQSGTFGFGWRLAVEDTDIQTTVLPTGHESTGIYNPFLIGTRVYLTLPTGQRVGFTFAPVQEQINGLTYYMPAYTADSGVSYTLSSAGGPLIRAGNRYYDLKTGLAYNPAADLYAGPEYVLTAPDGTAYDLSTARGVQEMIRPDGTRLYFSDSGITASTGESIQFVHDASGRITSIIAPDGTRVIYAYDSSGNLVSARNLVSGQSSRYGYQAGPVHLLTEAVSPANGTRAVVLYAPSFKVLPLTADLGSSGEFLASNQTGTLAAGGTDRYAFSLRPSELLSTSSGGIYLGISVQAAVGSALQPGVPSIAGLTPVATSVGSTSSFALYAISQSGLELLDVSGTNHSTSGAYTVHMFVAGDVNGDGKVDGTDGQFLAGALGTSVGQPGYLPGADANQDGVINATDAQLLASDLGFQESLPPVSTAGQATTHLDLAVTVDLATLATDPGGDPLFFRVLNPVDGTATLSPDGHTVTFVPAPGYTGPASFQYVADDGYGTSATAAVSVNVSAAPLVSLDFTQRTPDISLGDSQTMSVTGDFADQKGVALPTSYVSFQMADPTVATVSSSSQITAVAEGSTELVVSSHGILAATVVDVADPNDPVPPDYSGLTVSPQAITLADDGGTQQLDVEVIQGEPLDLTGGFNGTVYYTSNSHVATVSADGLVAAVGDGTATITVITDGQEVVIPVQVKAPQPGPQAVDASGGVVQASDGAQAVIPPGALSASTTVQISPVANANLPEGAPAGFHFVGAEQLGFGGQTLAQPAQMIMPVPSGTPIGDKVYVYLATTLLDDTGTEVPVWQEVDVAVVGADGIARSGSSAYQGILVGGTYAFSVADDPSQVTQVTMDLDPSSFDGSVGARYALVDPFGENPVASIFGFFGSIYDAISSFVLDMTYGTHTAQVEAIPLAGPPSFTTVQLTVVPGTTHFTQVIAPLPPNNLSPVIQSTALNIQPNQPPTLTLTGMNFGTDAGSLRVLFQTMEAANSPAPAVGTILQLSGNQLTVTVPQTVALGMAGVTVERTLTDSHGNQWLKVASAPAAVLPPGGYAFTAQNASGSVAVLDGQATLPDPQNPGKQIANPDFGKLVTTIDVGAGSRPTYLALTHDDTRAYVILAGTGSIAVIDTVGLHQFNVGSSTGDIQLPSGAAPFQIVIDQDDEYAYISDQNNYTSNGANYGVVYVVDIDPNSPKFDSWVETIHVPDHGEGFRGLALNSDGSRLFVASPNNVSYYTRLQSPPVGHIEVFDTSIVTSKDYWPQTKPIDADQYPFGVAATSDPNVMIFTNYLDDNNGFGVIHNAESTSPSVTFVNVNLGVPLSPFDVSNVRSVVLTPDGQFAFVAGWSFPDPNIPSHNAEAPADDPGGSTIGIIENPLGPNPRMVAATRSIPNGFPPDLAISPDGNYLYASFPNVPVEKSTKGALFVYDINAIESAIANTDPALLKRYAVDDLVNGQVGHNSAIDTFAAIAVDQNNTGTYPVLTVYDPTHSPIGLGGSPWGIAIQSALAVVKTSGTGGDFIPVDLATLVQQAIGVTPTSFTLNIGSFIGGQVALDSSLALRLSSDQAVTPAQALADANQALADAQQADILSHLLPGQSGPSELFGADGNGQFYFIAAPQGISYNSATGRLLSNPSYAGPTIATGRFTFTSPSGAVRQGIIRITVNPAPVPPRIPPHSITELPGFSQSFTNGEIFTAPLEAFTLNPYVPRGSDGGAGANSGVTVGIGYDLGQQTGTTTLVQELWQAGLTLPQISAFVNEVRRTQDTAISDLQARAAQLTDPVRTAGVAALPFRISTIRL